MKMNEYQKMAKRTAVYPGCGTGSVLALSYLGLGLGEAGEVQNKIKKILRDDAGVVTDEARVAIMGEVGDLLWYVSQLVSELDLELEAVAYQNLAKLEDRHQRGVITGSGDDR